MPLIRAAGTRSRLGGTLLREARLSGTAAGADWLLCLPRFSCLATLELRLGCGIWPPTPGAGWDGLPVALESLVALRTLRTLRLRALAQPPQAAVDAIATLAQLTELDVAINHGAQRQELPCLLPLARLKGLLVVGGGIGCAQLLQVTTADGDALPLTGCRWEADSGGSLEVYGLRAGSTTQLEGLVAELLPPGAPLRSLALQFCQLDFTGLCGAPSAPHGASALACLTALHLHRCGAEPHGQGSTDRALAGLLAASGPGLRLLAARHCQLSELPAARCLAGLEKLDMRHCQLARLPPALSAATSLTSLCLDSNHIVLTPDDVAGSWPLAALPAGCPLVSLSLGSNSLRDLPPGPYLAGLTRLSLSCNALRRLPPALADTTSLRALTLGGNASLRVGVMDVWRVLSQLKGVAHINFTPGTVSSAAVLAAALTAPHLGLYS
ncbi:hypothetical protein ABPG75_003076 [Micractinium tetrahymenae]